MFFRAWIALFISTLSMASVDPAQLLLSAYGSQCPSVTSFTNNASLNLSLLRSTIMTISEREQCKGISSQQEVIANFERAYSRYQTYSQMQEDRAKLESLVADYTMFLAQGDSLDLGGTEVDFARSQILDAQAQIFSLNSDISRFASLGHGFEQGAGGFLRSFDSLLTSINGSNQCLDNKQSLYTNLLSTGLSVASLFVSPANSLYFAASGALVNSISNYLQDKKYTDIANTVDSIHWPDALSCVSEALTRNYCQAHSNEKLFKSYVGELENSDVMFPGIDLLNYSMRGLDDWLVQVRAGSPSVTPGDFDDRSKPINLKSTLDTVTRALPVFKKLRDDQHAITETRLMSDTIYNSLVGLAKVLKNPWNLYPGMQMEHSDSKGPKSPIYQTRTITTILYELIGLEGRPKACADNAGNPRECNSFKEYINAVNRKLTVEDWAGANTIAKNIISDTARVLNDIIARTNASDPGGLFTLATRNLHGKPNAIEGLNEILSNAERIEEYIAVIACEQKNDSGACHDGKPVYPNIYFSKYKRIVETKRLTQTVKGLIDEAINPRPLEDEYLPTTCQNGPVDTNIFIFEDEFKEKAVKISSCLTEILQLSERGNDIYFSKVREMVSIELEEKLHQGEFEGQIEDVLNSTRDDLVERLRRMYSTSSDTSIFPILKGLNSSKDMSRKTMKLFGETFNKNLVKTINDKTNNRIVRDDLCFRVLPLVVRAKDGQKLLKGIYKSCKNARIKESRDGPTLVWSEFVKEKRKFIKKKYEFLQGYDQRACAQYNFNIKNRVIRERLKRVRN